MLYRDNTYLAVYQIPKLHYVLYTVGDIYPFSLSKHCKKVNNIDILYVHERIRLGPVTDIYDRRLVTVAIKYSRPTSCYRG